MKDKEPDASFVAGKKDMKVGIVGAGMSGLMSALLLDSVGIHNWEISESSHRVGGYVDAPLHILSHDTDAVSTL